MGMYINLDSIKTALDELLGCPVLELSGEQMYAVYYGEQLYFGFHMGIYLRIKEDEYLFLNGAVVETESGGDDFFLYIERPKLSKVPRLVNRLLYKPSRTTADSWNRIIGRSFIVAGCELYGFEQADGEVQPFAIILKDAFEQQLNIRFMFPANGLYVYFGQEEWETFRREDFFGRKLKCMYST